MIKTMNKIKVRLTRREDKIQNRKHMKKYMKRKR